MTTLRIAHAEPRPGRLANGEFQILGHLVVLADDAGYRAVPIWMRGDPGASDLADLLERPAGQVITDGVPQELTYLMVSARKRGDVDAVREAIGPVIKQAREASLPEYEAMAMANRAWVAWRCGDEEAATADARAALSMWEGLPSATSSTGWHCGRCWPWLWPPGESRKPSNAPAECCLRRSSGSKNRSRAWSSRPYTRGTRASLTKPQTCSGGACARGATSGTYEPRSRWRHRRLALSRGWDTVWASLAFTAHNRQPRPGDRHQPMVGGQHPPGSR